MFDDKGLIDGLIQEIQQAFSDVMYPGDDKLVINPNHYEADDVERDFKGKHWKAITLKVLYEHRLSLVLFTPEAFRFYLPAFIIVPLSADIDSKYLPGEILEFAFYALIPLNEFGADKDMFLDRLKGLTSQQRSAIAKFVMYFLDSNPIHAKLYRSKAEEFWQNKQN